MPPQIVEARANGAEIDAIIEERLIPAVHDLERSKTLMALITFTLCLMKPDITAEEAKAGVEQVSQFMCLFLSEVQPLGDDAGEVDPKKLMN